MLKYYIYMLFLFFFINMINLSSEPKNEKKIENFQNNVYQNESYKEIEKNWLQELKKEKHINTESNNTETKQFIMESIENPQNQTIFGEAPSFISIFFRFIMILVVFTSIIMIMIKYFKKKNLILTNHTGPIEVLASIPLMSGKFLQIVDIAGQIVILGISEHNISLVQVVDNSVIAEKIRLWRENYKKRERELQWDWKEILSKILGNHFSLWHNKIDNSKSFYSELVQNQDKENIKFDDLMQLLEIQKKKLKRYEQL